MSILIFSCALSIFKIIEVVQFHSLVPMAPPSWEADCPKRPAPALPSVCAEGAEEAFYHTAAPEERQEKPEWKWELPRKAGSLQGRLPLHTQIHLLSLQEQSGAPNPLLTKGSAHHLHAKPKAPGTEKPHLGSWGGGRRMLHTTDAHEANDPKFLSFLKVQVDKESSTPKALTL